MTKIFIQTNDSIKNQGDRVEWGVCQYYGVERISHDSGAYDKASDLSVGDMHMSIKSPGFSLMSGKYSNGSKDFDTIWNIYERNTHSNTFAFGFTDGVVYIMNLLQFKQFVYKWCSVGYDSGYDKNGNRQYKIRCKHESKKMRAWLEEMCVA